MNVSGAFTKTHCTEHIDVGLLFIVFKFIFVVVIGTLAN